MIGVMRRRKPPPHKASCTAAGSTLESNKSVGGDYAKGREFSQHPYQIAGKLLALALVQIGVVSQICDQLIGVGAGIESYELFQHRTRKGGEGQGLSGVCKKDRSAVIPRGSQLNTTLHSPPNWNAATLAHVKSGR